MIFKEIEVSSYIIELRPFLCFYRSFIKIVYQCIRVDRCCLVSAKAIHDVTKTINLINGESLDYARRRKREIVEQLRIERQKIGQTLERNDAPASREAYHRHYASFDHVPFAFADIEMVFSEAHSAVDWIFRYGNEALAELEKLPLEQLIDHSFGSIFPNMDAKWLRVYERTALYDETLEITDYSPEIDTKLKIVCFPTFPGHCGCMLFDCRRIQTVQGSTLGGQPDEIIGDRLIPASA